MMHGFQQIITQAERCYNFVVHGLPPLGDEMGVSPLIWRKKLMESISGNLGYLNCSWQPPRDRARRKAGLDVPLFGVPQSPLPSLPRQLSRLQPSAETAETPPPALRATGAGVPRPWPVPRPVAAVLPPELGPAPVRADGQLPLSPARAALPHWQRETRPPPVPVCPGQRSLAPPVTLPRYTASPCRGWLPARPAHHASGGFAYPTRCGSPAQ